ncbi:MAG: hypothetical protein ACKV2V_03905 [Blastocatellia bacterium]
MKNREKTLSEAFERFLAWLHPDREQAWIREQTIRRGLESWFRRRGCPDTEAEILTSETMDRVMLRVPDIADTWAGEPARFVYGVAKNILREFHRGVPPELPVANPAQTRQREREYACREHCLSLLADADRQLILEYYGAGARGAGHRVMAEQRNLTPNTLAVRVHRLRADLDTCAGDCLKKFSGADVIDPHHLT